MEIHRSALAAAARARRHLASQAPAYAFNPVAPAPSTKFPAVAAQKALAVSRSADGAQLATVDDTASPISSVALVVQAGPRFQSGIAEVGAAQWLKALGFKATNTRSAVRITGEAEILGSSLSAALSRESLILNVDCNRDDVGDAVALLGDVVDGIVRRDTEPWGIYTREFVRKTKQWNDAIEQVARDTALAHTADPATLVLDQLHFAAYRTGLGNALYPPAAAQLDVEGAVNFAARRFQPAHMSLVGLGVAHDDLVRSVQASWSSLAGNQVVSSSSSSAQTAKQQYYGGEAIDTAPCQDVHYAVAFNGAALGSGADFYTAAVLKHVLGGSESAGSMLHWATKGDVTISPINLSYSDAGLFGVYVRAPDAAAVSSAVTQSVAALKECAAGKASADAVKRGIQLAKFALASEVESSSRLDKVHVYGTQLATVKKLVPVADMLASLDAVTPAAVAAFAGRLVKSKPSVASVGDAFAVPHIDQLGL